MMRTKDKIDEIEDYLDELGSVIPSDFDEYKQNFKTRAACERYFEKIIGAVVDLAFLVIKEKKYKTPEEDKQAFDILTKENIISINLAENLKNAKGMRNILAHEYGKVNDEIVFHTITEELEKDVLEFVGIIKNVK